MNLPSATSVAVDPSVCPLCNQPNHCLLAAGALSNDECWCSRVAFPPALLARVPEHARRRACICERCWSGATQTTAADTRTHP
ncbi:MAG TPA: cysteine-rich CWC family protein [Verrucomicrobiota bacterium]|nr:cysteine-rich CWC family protein [Verrucomicrobiota bacterium]HQL77520.1 cysteine-rich CWC family protein [Verrucomicrobiota bacterium]